MGENKNANKYLAQQTKGQGSCESVGVQEIQDTRAWAELIRLVLGRSGVLSWTQYKKKKRRVLYNSKNS
jgi:hypothetical protein